MRECVICDCLVYVIVKNLGFISEPVLSLVFSDLAKFGCIVNAECEGSVFCCSVLTLEDLSVV